MDGEKKEITFKDLVKGPVKDYDKLTVDCLMDMLKNPPTMLACKKKNGWTVFTYHVHDSVYQYETVVSHPAYGNQSVVVANADTADDALGNQKKWVDLFREGKLPEKLVDSSESRLAHLCIMGGEGKNDYPRLDLIRYSGK